MKKFFSHLFYTSAVLILLLYIGLEVMPNFDMSEMGRVVILCGSVILLYFGGLLKSTQDNTKPMKVNLYIFFVLYLILFITLTLFDPMWSRNGFKLIHWSKEIFNNYLNNSFNIIPFKTIMSYIHSFNSLYSTRTIMFNLLGNLVCLMPMAFFLPLIFKKQKKWYIFLLTCILFVVGIELLQFITLSGSCDIDDVILNVLGAMIMYGIIKINTVNKIIKNIFLLEKNRISIIEVIITSVIIIIIIIGIIGLIKYRNKLYDNNLTEYKEPFTYKLEIVDESEVCAEALEKFYEDDVYTYYFNCIKSDNVYAIINDKEKYLVKDLLNNNKTKYIVTIEKLENNGLKFIKEPKHEYVSYEVDIPINDHGIYVTPTIEVNIEKEDVLNIKEGEQAIDNKIFKFSLFFIPKEMGETKLDIIVKENRTNEIIQEYHYDVSVDNTLELYYEEK